MKIYITNLSQYNAGRLIGEWITLPCSEDELKSALSRILCLDEEYFITDCEDAPFSISEHENLFELNRKVELWEELEEDERLATSYLLSLGYKLEESICNCKDVILYPEQSMEDVAYSLVEEGCFGDIPTSLENYIDYEAIARDLSYDGYTEVSEGVFYYAE